MAQRTLNAFGDSFTNPGTGASLSQYAYINQLSSAKQWALTNHAVSGSMAPDQATAIYGTAPNGQSLSTYMIGINDQGNGGPTPTYLEVFRSCVMAEAAWLGIKNSDIQTGRTGSWTFSGSWGNTGVYGIGKVSTTNGDTATISLSGTVIYLAVIQQDGTVGQYDIAVDGVDYGTFNTTPNAPILTRAIGTNYAPRLHRIDGLVAASHTVVITNAGVTGATNALYVDWAWSNGSRTAGAYPKVWLAGPTPCTAAGYTAGGGSLAGTEMYNNAMLQIAAQLAADGLNVVAVNPNSFWDVTQDTYTDGVHPQNEGHAKIAGCVLAMIP